MITLLGGLSILGLGLVLLGFWWGGFAIFIKGLIPILLMVGGGVAFYLGYEEFKSAREFPESSGSAGTSSQTEIYKAEAEKYREEVNSAQGQPGAFRGVSGLIPSTR